MRVHKGDVSQMMHVCLNKDVHTFTVVVKPLHTLENNLYIMAVLSSDDFYSSHFYCDRIRGTHATLPQKETFVQLAPNLNLIYMNVTISAG